MSSVAKENYLKALFFLDQEEGTINVTALSKSLGVSKPTTTNMIKRLISEGWVSQEKYQPIQITEKGRLAAKRIIRKHRLTELFLHDIMGFAWDEVHEIAEQMEHIDSGQLFDRMDEMLGFPKEDPHGSPIPDKFGEMRVRAYHPLTTCKPGQQVVLKALKESEPELFQVLNQLHIKLGAIFKVIRIEPYDQTIVVEGPVHKAVSISQKVGQKLLVEAVNLC
ncbi:MAG: metal-dependent transcriptional regulator [Saprospiraceae bacterium]|nr:metal-dependent transcriptional regulator [Saprospiraceae bacterium]